MRSANLTEVVSHTPDQTCQIDPRLRKDAICRSVGWQLALRDKGVTGCED